MRDIVDAGIGARIDRQHQSFLEHDPYAIGHRRASRTCSYCAVDVDLDGHGLDLAAAPAAHYRDHAGSIETGCHSHILIGGANAICRVESGPAE